jgi:hypothetical protein
MSDERAARALGALRQGWHGLAGGDAGSCPGCPVCALTEQAGRLDPAAAEHLQAAAGHLVAAGRELLAVLGEPGRSQPGPDAPADPSPGRPVPEPAGEPPSGGAGHRSSDPVDAPPPGWTKIPVTMRPTDEEHP